MRQADQQDQQFAMPFDPFNFCEQFVTPQKRNTEGGELELKTKEGFKRDGGSTGLKDRNRMYNSKQRIKLDPNLNADLDIVIQQKPK